MEIVQRFSFLVSGKKEIVQWFFFVMSNALKEIVQWILFVMSNALKEIVQRFDFFVLYHLYMILCPKIVQIVDNFYFSSSFISIDLFNFVSNYTMVWSVV